MNIVFLGSADFGIPAFSHCAAYGHTIAGIVTTPPKPRGRGLHLERSPVHRFSVTQGWEPVYTPVNLQEPAFIDALKRMHADLFLVVAFRLLPPAVFEIPPLGTYNLHASLLPRFRGPAPIQRAIEAGEKRTGVTVFRINRSVDTGDIVLQKETDIGEEETAVHLYTRLSILGADAVVESLKRIETGQVHCTVQDHTKASPAPKLKKEEGHIDWSLHAKEIFNKIRAFKPFPGTYTLFHEKQLGIQWGVPVADDSLPRGRDFGVITAVTAKYFDVQCSDSLLRVTVVKPAGKKEMPVSAFLNGTKIEQGTLLR